MNKEKLVNGIDFCIEIASRYGEPWRVVVFEKLLEKLLPADSCIFSILNKGESDDATMISVPEELNQNVIKLSNLLQLSVEQLLEIYEFRKDVPFIKHYDFDAQRPQAQMVRELSALYLIACDIVYNKQSVSIDELAAVAREWRVYDPSNFAYNHIQKAKWFSKNNDEVKLLYNYRKEIAPILRRILGITTS
ncbi:MAG: hypothetical protein AB1556_13355 [Bacillota bacterium]